MRTNPLNSFDIGLSKTAAIGAVLFAALIGFEIFNFDTTRYALLDLLGGLTFWRLEWASILAFAFCSIDFAGLIRMFTPEQGWDEPKEVWLLTGAWLLGATMNAVMTWYAVSLAINEREIGTATLNREMIAIYSPIFVAVLVWLTRILFIGAISVAGDRLLHHYSGQDTKRRHGRPPRHAPQRDNSHRRSPFRSSQRNRQNGVQVSDFEDDLFSDEGDL